MSDVKFIDASGWNEQFWLNSGGTRAKKILLDNDAQSWFFKCSEKKEAKSNKPAKHYRFEFWSEVLAYQLGEALLFFVLHILAFCKTQTIYSTLQYGISGRLTFKAFYEYSNRFSKNKNYL